MQGLQFSVTTSRAVIVDGTKGSGVHYPQSAVIKNPTGGADVYLGGPNVDTSTNYFLLPAGETLIADVVSDQIWAMVTSGSQAVSVLIRFA